MGGVEEEAGGWGVPAPYPGAGPTFYERPMSSEGDTGAGQRRDLREVWEPHPKGNCLPSGDRKEGSSGRDALYICSLRALDHTYK